MRNVHGYDFSSEGTAPEWANEDMKLEKKDNATHPFLYRFRDKAKRLYVARLSYFYHRSIQQIFESRLFRRDWFVEDEDMKKKQKKLGISDEQLLEICKAHKYRS